MNYAMTSDMVGLLATVLANPNDNTQRRIYADAVGENGQMELAEYIRGTTNSEDSLRLDEATRKKYIQMIADHPKDDALRLGYAAWLEAYADQPDRNKEECTRDRARGEFIRLQITIDEMLKPASAPQKGDRLESVYNRVQARIEENPELQNFIAREDALQRQHFVAWANSDLGDGAIRLVREGVEESMSFLSSRRRGGGRTAYRGNFAHLDNLGPVFERGMLREVHVRANNLVAHAATLCDPPASRLSIIIDNAVQAEAVFALPQLENIRDLQLRFFVFGKDVDTVVKMMANCPRLQKLQGLKLSGMTDDALKILAGSQNFSSLETLVVYDGEGITVAGVQSIGESKHLKNLRELKITNCNGSRSSRSLITSTNWPTLQKLPNFKDMHLNDDGSLSKNDGMQRGR